MFQTENLSAGYGKKTVLRGLSAQIAQDRITVLIGPNGSGKTTLLRVLSRALRPSAGRVLFNGTDLGKIPAGDCARRIAAVMQSPVPEDWTVENYVLTGRIPFMGRYQLFENRHDRQIAGEAMERTGTAGLGGCRLSRLSLGELQLVRIARALTQQPHALLLDEPTSHLDIGHQQQVLELLRSLNRNAKLCVLMVLHDLNLAACWADELMLMSAGKLCAQGRPAEVLTEESVGGIYRTKVSISTEAQSGRLLIFPKISAH